MTSISLILLMPGEDVVQICDEIWRRGLMWRRISIETLNWVGLNGWSESFVTRSGTRSWIEVEVFAAYSYKEKSERRV